MKRIGKKKKEVLLGLNAISLFPPIAVIVDVFFEYKPDFYYIHSKGIVEYFYIKNK